MSNLQTIVKGLELLEKSILESHASNDEIVNQMKKIQVIKENISSLSLTIKYVAEVANKNQSVLGNAVAEEMILDCEQALNIVSPHLRKVS